ncbi:MAG: hypothetical protein JWP63_5705 [Candidatus Solibacter sp.]|jgi:hypothetical protein|nr:hypothetical protein [Candidatus Solibacter sp.]
MDAGVLRKFEMAPAPKFCRKRQRLVEQFLIAVKEHNELQNAQVEGLIAGKGFSLKWEIADARERRDRAKHTILAHQQSHGCK